MDKIEDFGVHANSYYQLKVEIYKTKLDEQPELGLGMFAPSLPVSKAKVRGTKQGPLLPAGGGYKLAQRTGGGLRGAIAMPEHVLGSAAVASSGTGKGRG